MYFLTSVCVVFLAFCVFEHNAAQTDIQNKLFTTSLECIGDFPLQLEQIKALRSKTVPDDKNTKCFINCLFQHLKMIDADGKVSFKEAKIIVRKYFKEGDNTLTKIDELFVKCAYVNDKEVTGDAKECERATLLTRCILENASELGLHIKF